MVTSDQNEISDTMGMKSVFKRTLSICSLYEFCQRVKIADGHASSSQYDPLYREYNLTNNADIYMQLGVLRYSLPLKCANVYLNELKIIWLPAQEH